MSDEENFSVGALSKFFVNEIDLWDVDARFPDEMIFANLEEIFLLLVEWLLVLVYHFIFA